MGSYNSRMTWNFMKRAGSYLPFINEINALWGKNYKRFLITGIYVAGISFNQPNSLKENSSGKFWEDMNKKLDKIDSIYSKRLKPYEDSLENFVHIKKLNLEKKIIK